MRELKQGLVTDLGLRKMHDRHDLLDLMGNIQVGGLAREVARLTVRVGRDVPKEARVVVDAGVRVVVQGPGEPASGGKGALVPDHLGHLDPGIQALKEVTHCNLEIPIRFIYRHASEQDTIGYR